MLAAFPSAASITEPAKWIGILFLGTAPLQITNSLAAHGAGAQIGSAPPQPAATAPARLSSGVAEVIRLAESGVSEDAVLAYIKACSTPFDCSAEILIYLTDVGLAPAVIEAMIERDKELAGRNSRDKAPAPMEPAAAVSTVTDPSSSREISEATPAANASNAPVEVNYFYNQLSPYGTWVSLEGTGWCWQPHCCVVSPGWRPYCHAGHWVYTECGWYWQSDYSWGWAPFHYGRWHHHERCGWVWCPDREWGPAWVTWRVSRDHCGWAPLPPGSVLCGRPGLASPRRVL
jgi:hypothetical protein